MSVPERNAYTRAQDQVHRLEAEPLANEAAGMPLQQARLDLANADEAAAHHNADAVVYWSYLASREAETGQAMVDELQARNQIGSATAERERMLMDYQRRRAELAQQRAAAAEQRAQQAEAELQQVQQQQAQQQQQEKLADAQTQVDQARQQAQQAEQAAQQAQQQSAEQSQQVQAQARQQIQQAQAQTEAAQAQARQAQIQADQAREQEQQARHELESLQARQTSQGMVLTLSSSLLFATGRDTLEPGAMPAINSVAAFLHEHPMVKLRVEGFTDNRGSDPLNDALSQRRAQAVANALESDGVDSSRYVVIGRGASMPLASNSTSAGRQQNRRVELLFSDTEGRFASNEAGEALR
ncbi:MAG TPA: OmpA family protein [Steroidobacteraceae bacterium]|jgi:outer membrane protein OmpA-like peptidoglycan-associated protein|nr:OmpA family protein [Steroidobacteraceae bacterium]